MKKLITLTAIIFIGLFSGCANQATIKDLVKAEVQSQIKVALNNYEVGRDYIEKNKTVMNLSLFPLPESWIKDAPDKVKRSKK